MTFAGSPDRVEAQLVPDAGYELDTFQHQRLSAPADRRRSSPASPGPASAPPACRAILRRRRPDVVFGAGGYVAGPDGAGRRDDAHPGRDLRGRRPPRAREPAGAAVRAGASSSPIRSPAATGHASASSAGRSRARARSDPAGRGARDLRAAAGRRRSCSSPARSPAPARSTSSSIESFGEVGPAILHISGRARLPRSCAAACSAPTTG